MSGQIGGTTRALPFTGLATLPLVIVGLVATAVGAVLTRVRSHDQV